MLTDLEWVLSCGLPVNISTAKCLVMSRIRAPPKPILTVDGWCPLEQVSIYKYQGITISDDLSWSQHIVQACCRARRLLGHLYHKLADRKCVGCLYKCLVRPILEYRSSVWDPYQVYNIRKLEWVHNFGSTVVGPVV